MMKVKPIIKWAGGKRQIINELVKRMPDKYNKYFEPFVGGGALLFELMPEKAIINDTNEDLISIYKTLSNKNEFHLMIKTLDEHEHNHSEEYFYKIRSMDREPAFFNIPLWERAARAIYLNKSCFNGLFRVNSKGYFNVPFGKKNKVITYDYNNISIINEYFINNDIEITATDFSEAANKAQKGDFVYFDPPYDPIKKKTSFTSYTKDNFGVNDQIRLAKFTEILSSKGVYVMLSNHNTELINDIYRGFNIEVIHAKRMINSDSTKRGHVEEVIITNY